MAAIEAATSPTSTPYVQAPNTLRALGNPSPTTYYADGLTIGTGEVTGFDDAGKLHKVADMLGMSPGEVIAQAHNAEGLLSLMRSRSVDVSLLRGVFERGDLFDITA